MASVSYLIANLLEKMTSNDKDFRFMATNDLITELLKDNIKLDDDSERKVVRMVLRLLEDKNGEVQNLAVKCLGPLVNKVKVYQVETIVDSLCANMVSDKEQLRHISSIGLKTVISELPVVSNLAANVCRRITGRLSKAIEKQTDVSVQLEALDILADLLSRFGSLLLSFHSVILNALLPQLRSSRQTVRNRSIIALSHLVLACNTDLYDKLISYLFQGLSVNESTSTTRTIIQCIAAICRQAGYRFGENIEKVVPLIVQYMYEEDDELREHSLQAFEAFIYQCPKEIATHIDAITNLCLQYITYDPNHIYDENIDEEAGSMEIEEEEESETDEYSDDDDDMSWKIRRSAAKCLEAIISTRPDLLPVFYKTVSPVLISRFKEREENVRSDIFHAYIALLRHTNQPASVVTYESDRMESDEMPVDMLQTQVPAMIKALKAQIKDKSIKARQLCFNLLKELVAVLYGALSNHMSLLISGVHYSLGDKNSSSNMKLDTLTFIHCLLSSHPPEIFHPHMKIIIASVITAVNDPFYKITSEALRVLQELVKVIRPLNDSTMSFDSSLSFDFTLFINDVYTCTLLRLKAPEIDQEVKERAILCMGQIICNLGDFLENELHVCLPILLDRLRNEITRLTTVKALTEIAASSLRVDLPIMNEALPLLGSFLCKNQRALKLSTLSLLDTLVINYSHYLHTDLLRSVTHNIPPLLNESDLHIAQLSLVLLTSIARVYPDALVGVGVATDEILPEILQLVKSPLLQGGALESMLQFFQALLSCRLPNFSYNNVLEMLIRPVTLDTNLHKQTFHSLAKCVAAIAVIFPQESYLVVNQFMGDIMNASSDSQHVFALLVIGELGRQIDLSGIHSLEHVILDSFSHASEEVKAAASYTLGNIAIGNLSKYLPFVLEVIEMKHKRQYLLLQSLKEIIVCQAATKEGIENLLPFVPEIWSLLFRHCECTEEGSRNVVAECLGELTLIDPINLLPLLQQSLSSPSALMRTTVVSAIKFTISDRPQEIDSILRLCIGDFLAMIEDPDLNVRRVALVAFNSAAHNKPSLIRDLLDTLLPKLYKETKIKRDLIREVEMGPFKHTVDDGLDIRKAAYECMYTLLDTCLHKLDIFEFLNHLEGGLCDHYDIKMLTYLMATRLAQLCPNAVLQRLENLIEPLKVTCTMKVKANSVKQEQEKQDELKRSAMRAVASLLSIPDADKNPHLSEFVSQLKSASDLQPMFESIQRDSTVDCFLMDQS